jgi:hypothetical protein
MGASTWILQFLFELHKQPNYAQEYKATNTYFARPNIYNCSKLNNVSKP